MIAPATRLVGATAAWTCTAAVVILWPASWPVAASTFGGLALAALWDALALIRVPAVGVARRLPARALVDRPAELAIELTNPGSRPAIVDLIDELPLTLPPGEAHLPAVAVPPNGATVLRTVVRPSRRGDVRLGPVVLLQGSRWGLWRRRSAVDSGATLTVYPDASRYVRARALSARRVLTLLGARTVRARGEGMEFDSLRDYVVGDDVRRIDWTATARRARPITRVYRHERHRTVLIAVDASRLMGAVVDGRTKLDHAVDAALALAYAAILAGDDVGMLAFDASVRSELPPAPHRHLGAFVDLLHAVEPRFVEASWTRLAEHLARRRRRRTLVIALSDFVDADATGLVAPLALVAVAAAAVSAAGRSATAAAERVKRAGGSVGGIGIASSPMITR